MARSWDDYFAGAVPAGLIFDLQVDDMRVVARMSPPQGDLREAPFAELCLIGLVAYFEGFCKNQVRPENQRPGRFMNPGPSSAPSFRKGQNRPLKTDK